MSEHEKSVKAMKEPKLMTLTLRNKPFLSKDDMKRLRSSFIKLMRRKYYKEKIRGGLYVSEVVNKGKGWNIHLHVLFDGDFIPQKKLSRDWFMLTGDSFVVDIRPADSPKEGLRYILKYLSKPPSLRDEADGYVYDEVLKGVRLVQPFGSLYHVQPLERPKFPCPKCGSIAWMRLPDVEQDEVERRVRRMVKARLRREAEVYADDGFP